MTAPAGSIHVVFTLTSPLSHGGFGPPVGNAQLIRRMPLALPNGALVHVPAVSGNALRGSLRRIIMRDLLALSGLDRESPGWDALYAAVANGGHLEGASTALDPGYVRELREALPALSVFGAALRTWFLEGRMRVGMCWPRCRETYEAGLVAHGTRGAEDLVAEHSQVRHVDREMQDPDISGVTPMPTTMETLVTGSVLQSAITFHGRATDVERSCIAWGLDRLEVLGGKSASGLGSVQVEHDCRHPGASVYAEWRETASPRAALEDLASKLSAATKGKKSAKKKGGKDAPAPAASHG